MPLIGCPSSLQRKPVNINNYNNTYQLTINFPSTTEQPVDLPQANALYNQGIAFFTQGDYKNAISSYEKALTEKNNTSINTARIQYAMGLAYKYDYNIDEAVAMYTQALGTLQSLLEISEGTEYTDIENEIKYVHYLLSAAYLEKKEFQRALDECNLCSTIEPIFLSDDNSEYTFGPASVESLRGKIYAGSYYSSHSLTLAMEEKDLGYTLDDALYSLEKAILKKDAQYFIYDSEEFSPDSLYVHAYYNWSFYLSLNPAAWLKEGVYVISQKDSEMAGNTHTQSQYSAYAGIF